MKIKKMLVVLSFSSLIYSAQPNDTKYLQEKSSNELLNASTQEPAEKLASEWNSFIDNDSHDLMEKITYLKKAKDQAHLNTLAYYTALEKLKKDFAYEVGNDEMGENEQQTTRQKLASLVDIKNDFGSIKLLDGKTFAAHWIDATESSQRDTAFKKLMEIIFIKLGNDFQQVVLLKSSAPLTQTKLYYALKDFRYLFDNVRFLLSNPVILIFLKNYAAMQALIIQQIEQYNSNQKTLPHRKKADPKE